MALKSQKDKETREPSPLSPKGSLEYYIRIINRDAVPDDILYDGAKFLVEDYDGLFIAKGTIQIADLEI